MDIQELIQILTNRLAYNNQQKAMAHSRGDLELVQFYDRDITKTQNTLNILQSADPSELGDLNNIRLAFR